MSWIWPCTLYQALTRRSGRAWLFLATLPSAYAPMARVMTDAWKRRSCSTMCASTATQTPYLAMRSGRPGRAGPGSAGPPRGAPAGLEPVSSVMPPSFGPQFPDRGPEGQATALYQLSSGNPGLARGRSLDICGSPRGSGGRYPRCRTQPAGRLGRGARSATTEREEASCRGSQLSGG